MAAKQTTKPQVPPKPQPKKIPVILQRTLYQSFKALPPTTRLIVSGGLCAFAGVGLLVSDFLEKRIPPPPSS